MNRIHTEVLRFGLTGCLATAVNYGVYMFLCHFALPLYAASAGGYFSGLLVSYFLGANWVFKRGRSDCVSNISGATAIKFTIVYAMGGLTMSAIVEGMYRMYQFDYRLCWLVGASFAVVSNFICSKLIVFK